MAKVAEATHYARCPHTHRYVGVAQDVNNKLSRQSIVNSLASARRGVSSLRGAGTIQPALEYRAPIFPDRSRRSPVQSIRQP
jgi:hypothetical protein